MKKLFALLVIASFASCDSAQRGESDYSDSAAAKTDTTTINYNTAPSDSVKVDSTVKDSIYHK